MMIDIETFNTTNDAVVFQVAVVIFNPDNEDIWSDQWCLDVDEQLELGRTVNASTLAFRLGIPGNAKLCLESELLMTLSDLSGMLDLIFDEFNPETVWAKGNFDFNILEDLLGEVPWKYYQCRELRTLMKECGVSKGDVAHTALEDCQAQIKQLKACREIIEDGIPELPETSYHIKSEDIKGTTLPKSDKFVVDYEVAGKSK